MLSFAPRRRRRALEHGDSNHSSYLFHHMAGRFC